MNPPTNRERVLAYLRRYAAEHGGPPPSLAAIAAGAGVRFGSVSGCLTMLRARGLIDYETGKLWTLRLVEDAA